MPSVKLVPELIDLLELFCSGDEISFAEIVSCTGFSRSKAAHLLQSLCSCSVLCRVRRGYYRCGKRLFSLCNPQGLLSLQEIAKRCSLNVMQWVNELTVISVRHGFYRCTLVKSRPEKNLQINAYRNGNNYPADWYSTASGRILLAYSDDQIISEVVRRCGIPERSVWAEAGSLPKLKKALENIRAKSSSVFMVDELVKAIAVPVADAANEKNFAISVAFPTFSCPYDDNTILDKLFYASEIMHRELALAGIEARELLLNKITD